MPPPKEIDQTFEEEIMNLNVETETPSQAIQGLMEPQKHYFLEVTSDILETIPVVDERILHLRMLMEEGVKRRMLQNMAPSAIKTCRKGEEGICMTDGLETHRSKMETIREI